MGGAGYGHSTAGALCLLGELHVNLSVILGDQAVVEVVVFDLQEDGLPVHIIPRLQEVDNLRGDEDAVAVYGLDSDEAGVRNEESATLSDETAGNNVLKHIPHEINETHNSEWMLSVRRKSCS